MAIPNQEGIYEVIEVVSEDIGRIIGRGGSKIRSIEESTCCKIKITKSRYGDLLTKVQLEGSVYSIEVAKKAIFKVARTACKDDAPSNSDLGDWDTPSTTGMGDVNRSSNKFPPKRSWNSKHFEETERSSFGGFKLQDNLPRFSSETSDDSRQSLRAQSTKSSQSSFVPIDWGALHAGRAEALAKKWSGLPVVVKDIYVEDPEISNMTIRDVEDFRSSHNGISVVDLSDSDRWPPNPVRTFEQAFRDYHEILELIERQKFEYPSPIQCQSWPVLMKGYDMVGIAQTGTGKTLAFLLPALIHTEKQPIPRPERLGPTVLVLSPTRELALQIEKEVQKFCYMGIRSVCVYGGGNRREQVKTVSKGVEIVIATPGRLNDLLMNGILCLRSVTYLILDEADRMLDMGFEPQIKKVLLDIRPDRQTVMTSATWPPGVRRLAESYMKDPFQVTVGTLDLRACILVEQHIEFIEEADKKRRTMQFISDMKDHEKVLIFCSRKSTADDLASDLSLHGLPVQSIHGDREQEDREMALEEFKTGIAPILVATDVASRGLDIKDITFVVNYDFPMHIEDYVHRVGRTGRAGSTGKALTFMSRSNWKWARQLIKILSDAQQIVPDDLVSMAERYDKWREREREGCRY